MKNKIKVFTSQTFITFHKIHALINFQQSKSKDLIYFVRLEALCFYFLEAHTYLKDPLQL